MTLRRLGLSSEQPNVETNDCLTHICLGHRRSFRQACLEIAASPSTQEPCRCLLHRCLRGCGCPQSILMMKNLGHRRSFGQACLKSATSSSTQEPMTQTVFSSYASQSLSLSLFRSRLYLYTPSISVNTDVYNPMGWPAFPAPCQGMRDNCGKTRGTN